MHWIGWGSMSPSVRRRVKRNDVLMTDRRIAFLIKVMSVSVVSDLVERLGRVSEVVEQEEKKVDLDVKTVKKNRRLL